jgi:hypothetical protein
VAEVRTKEYWRRQGLLEMLRGLKLRILTKGNMLALPLTRSSALMSPKILQQHNVAFVLIILRSALHKAPLAVTTATTTIPLVTPMDRITQERCLPDPGAQLGTDCAIPEQQIHVEAMTKLSLRSPAPRPMYLLI